MTIRLWRFCRRKHLDTVWSGLGAKIAGGRWSHPGVAMVYAAESAALAGMEVRVHTTRPPADYWIVGGELPDSVTVESIEPGALPENWRGRPAPVELQDIGTTWIKSESSLLLRVPSVPVPLERNLLLNPMHEEAHKISTVHQEPFDFDPGLFR